MRIEMKSIFVLWLAVIAAWVGGVQASSAQITLANALRTVAGTGTAGYSGDGKAAALANLDQPGGVAVDANRNLYIADTANHVIRRVDAVTGLISTFSGTGTAGVSTDGLAAASSQLNLPGSVAVDGYGDVLIADTGNNRVVVVYEGGGTMQSLIAAENPTVTAPVLGAMYTIAGNGTAGFNGDLALAIQAKLNAPNRVSVDTQGGIYIADTGNNRIRVVAAGGTAANTYITAANSSVTTPVVGSIYTIAGNGVATSTGDGALAGSATLNMPSAIALDLQNNLYISESGGHRVRAIFLAGTQLAGVIALEHPGTTATAEYIYTIAGLGSMGATGDGALASQATLNQPLGLAVDTAGNVYIADSGNGVVRMIAASTGAISTYAGSIALGKGSAGDGGLATLGQFETPNDLAMDVSGALYVADGKYGHRLRVVSANTIFPATNVGSTSGAQNILLQFGANMALSSLGAVASAPGAEYTVGTSANCPTDGVTVIAAGTVCTVPVSFAPALPGARMVPLVAISSTGTQYSFSLAGLGLGTQAAILPGKLWTVAGTGSSSFAGDGGAATAGKIWSPVTTSVDASGNLYINDNGNHRIRIVYAGGAVAARLITLENPTVTTPVVGDIYTLAGTGSTSAASADGTLGTSTALSTYIAGTAVDAAGNVYFCDQGSLRIRVISAQTGLIGTVAGVAGVALNSPNMGDYGPATSAKLYLPQVIALDGLGNLYLANGTYQIRKINLATGIITTVAGTGSSGTVMDGIPALTAKFSSMFGLTADMYGNIYFGDPASRRIATIYGGGTSNPAASLILATHPSLTAPVAGYIYTVAGYGTSGYSGDGGLATSAKLGYFNQIAVDAAGNIYFGDRTNQYIRKVDGGTGIIHTIAGTGKTGAAGDGGSSASAAVYNPYGVTVDGSGNLYIADLGNSRIRQITAAGYPLTFTSTTVGSTSTSQTVTLSNTGNSPWAQSAITLSSGFAAGSDSVCAANTPLSMGSSCTTSISFQPQVNGAVTGSLAYASGSMTAVESLNGTGIGGVTTATALAAPSSITYGQLIQVSASVTAGGSPVTSGTVTFTAGSVTLGSAQLDATGTASATLPTLGAGSYQLTAAFSQTGVNMASTGSSALVVNQAPLTVRADNQSVQYNQPLPAFTYSVSGLVNNDSQSIALTGAPTFTTTASQGSDAGTYTITLGAGTLASANYALSFANGTLTISGNVAQSITFAQIADTTYGVTPFAITPTASSNLPVSVTVLSGPVTISGKTLTITGAGPVSLQAIQGGNKDYAAATPVVINFNVAQAPLNIAVNSASRLYGGSDPAYSSSVTGMVNGDSLGGTLALSYSSTDSANSTVGKYAINATLSGPASANYSMTITPGVLSILQAPLALTINNASRSYGSSDPAFTASVTGLVNGDHVGTTIGESLSTAATATSPIGTYTINGSITGASAGQYNVTVTMGTLTITSATLSISANSTTRIYGAANPTFTGSYSGAVNGDTFTESYSTTATLSSNTGVYSIVPVIAGNNLADYTVSTSNGRLTIYQANSTLTVTVPSATLSYGSTVQLTATAVSSTSGTPTGTVTFYDGSTVLGTATLASGVGTLQVKSLLLGSHSISATYAGDYNFYGSNAAAVPISVIAPQYSVTPSSSTLTVTSGQTATTTLTVTSVGGYSGTVVFSCDNLPAAMSCGYTPATVQLNSSNTSQTVTLVVTTGGNTAMVHTSHTGADVLAAGFAVPGVLLLLGLRRRERMAMRRMLVVTISFLALGISMGVAGCGGSNSAASTATSTPSGSYTILVQVQASSGSSTVPLTITVK